MSDSPYTTSNPPQDNYTAGAGFSRPTDRIEKKLDRIIFLLERILNQEGSDEAHS